jgi:hypothetical protein
MSDQFSPLLSHRYVDRYDKLVLRWFFANEPNGEDRFIQPWCDSPQPRERPSLCHSFTESHVVESIGVGAAPLVPRVTIRSFSVVVGPHVRSRGVSGQDAQCRLEARHLPDPLLATDDRNAAALKLKRLKVGPGHPATGSGNEDSEVVEDCIPEKIVGFRRIHRADCAVTRGAGGRHPRKIVRWLG